MFCKIEKFASIKEIICKVIKMNFYKQFEPFFEQSSNAW